MKVLRKAAAAVGFLGIGVLVFSMIVDVMEDDHLWHRVQPHKGN